ncbi:MAG: tetratricopeptide repeat protein [Deltaproteobacteria bacterium]
MSIIPLIFAQESLEIRGRNNNKQGKKEELSGLQQQARLYRTQGMELQRVGNLTGAMALYQKAIEIDPSYAVVYNDLGVVYEAQGFTERAKESYLKSIKVDPNYVSPYSNLALLYENERKLDEAAFYWQKRAALGSPDDPWTQKARSRLDDIRLVLGKRTRFVPQEDEVLSFMQDVSSNLAALRQSQPEKMGQENMQISRNYFDKAKINYQKGDHLNALKEALEAQQLDPSNKDIEKFVEEVQSRLLSR